VCMSIVPRLHKLLYRTACLHCLVFGSDTIVPLATQ
jgi:hypothetical protein